MSLSFYCQPSSTIWHVQIATIYLVAENRGPIALAHSMKTKIVR
jgi:hypothetical protein